MQNIVLSIGGSVILSEEADETFLKKLASLLIKLSKHQRIFVIVGGGKIARKYISLARKLAFNEKTLDEIGIDITRVNAKLFANTIEIANKTIPNSTDEAMNMKDAIIVMGGTTPGHSTDMVGAELAEKTGAELFIIATNVNGIYDKDPNKYHDAKLFKEVTIQHLIDNYGTRWKKAGKNIVIDGPALAIIKKANIPTYVVNGKRLDQLEKAMTNQSFNGTKVTI